MRHSLWLCFVDRAVAIAHGAARRLGRGDDQAGRIVEFDLARGVRRVVTEGWHPTVGADGALTYLRSRQGSEAQVWLRDPNGRERQLTNAAGNPHLYPVFAADGATIVYARAHTLRDTSTFGTTWTDWHLFSIGRDGRHERQVTRRALSSVTGISATADANVVLFGMRHAAGQYIARVDLASGVMTRLGDDGESAPSVFPDGSYAFISSTGERAGRICYELFRRAGSAAPTQLTGGCSYLWAPAVAGDGRSIVYLSDPERDGEFEIWRLDVESRRAEQLPVRAD
jgi:Tol biopolymer transport system component